MCPTEIYIFLNLRKTFCQLNNWDFDFVLWLLTILISFLSKIKYVATLTKVYTDKKTCSFYFKHTIRLIEILHALQILLFALIDAIKNKLF